MVNKILTFFGFVFGITPIIIYSKQIKTRIQVKRWGKRLNLQRHSHVFQQLFQDVDGFKISRQARMKGDAFEFTYGEIEFLPFIALLSLVKPNKDTVFYDLGSGTGKAVLACALVYSVKKSVGVELFRPLYLSSCNRVEQLAKIKDYSAVTHRIELIEGDFLAANLTEATIIFINSSALFGPTWEILCSRLDKLPNLDTVITTSKPLLSSVFSVIKRTKIQMSWGVVYAYIHGSKN